MYENQAMIINIIAFSTNMTVGKYFVFNTGGNKGLRYLLIIFAFNVLGIMLWYK